MIRALAGRHSTENELLLTQLYESPHGFGGKSAPYIQRDIMLILARWDATYWLSHEKNHISTAHPWVRRAFVVASYVLGDEGNHWRKANIRGPFENLIRDWAPNKKQESSWQVPI